LNIEQAAKSNLIALRNNPYPGRGIILARSISGDLVQIYWIMGRSANSRNRIFKQKDGGSVFTDSADPLTAGDTSLTLYRAMAEDAGIYVVSNGDQTDDVIREYGWATNLSQMLASRQFEPDGPNFTQRITGMISVVPDRRFVQFAILRKSPFDDTCERISYEYEGIQKGFGYFVSTYSGDGNPLPMFLGEPLIMPVEGNIEEVSSTYWDALNEENRISLAVKFIDPESGRSIIRITNKYGA